MEHFRRFERFETLSQFECHKNSLCECWKKPSNVKSMIFGDDGDHNSTVLILHNWRGIRANEYFTDLPTCSNREHFVHLQPSKQVLEDAESYASKHFGGFEKYISVSARFEMITSKFRKMSKNQMHSKIQTVINE